MTACLLFRGRDFLHWRDYYDGRPAASGPLPETEREPLSGIVHTLLLLHYVDESFPEARCDEGGTCRLVQESEPTDLPGVLGLPGVVPSAGGAIMEALGTCAATALCDGPAVPEPVGPDGKKYLLYSPCVITGTPGECSQQFNNQLWGLQHALLAAEAMGRTLVLPHFMVVDLGEAPRPSPVRSPAASPPA